MAYLLLFPMVLLLCSFSGNWWKKQPLAYNNEKVGLWNEEWRKSNRRSRRRIHSAVPFPKPPVVPETEQTVYIAMRLAHSNTKHSFYREKETRSTLHYPLDSASGPRSWLKWHVTFSKRARPVSSVLRKSTPFHSILFSLCPHPITLPPIMLLPLM